jgi:hypothetical protein
MGLLSKAWHAVDPLLPDEQIMGLLGRFAGGQSRSNSPRAGTAPVAQIESRPLPDPGEIDQRSQRQGTGAGPQPRPPGRFRRGLENFAAIAEGGSAGLEHLQRRRAEKELADYLANQYGGGSQEPRLTFSDAGAEWQTPTGPNLQDILPKIIRAQGQGVNVAPYLADVGAARQNRERDDFLAGVPQADRPYARIAPGDYVKSEREARIPMIINPGNGSVVSIDRRSGIPKEIYRAPKQAAPGWEIGPGGRMVPTPGGPFDPDYIRQQTDARTRDPRETPTTTGRVLGGIYDKMSRGLPLSPGEQKLYDDAHRHSGSLLDELGLDDYGDEGGQPPPNANAHGPPPAAPPPKGPPSKAPLFKAPPKVDAGPPPQTAFAGMKEGGRRTFGNGQVWTIHNGKPERVK